MANLKETVEWIDGIYQIEKNDPVVGGEGGISNRQAEQLANRTGYLKKELEKRATTESPVLTGTPTAPTPAQSVNNQQIATTAFVKAAIAALVGSAPETLDTLAEIAIALGNDGNLKQVLLNEIVKKANLTDFTALKYLLVGIPFPYPLSEVPLGCLAFNGQAFSTSTYPELAKKYSSGRLPDLRGEFIRGWDNGRGVDIGRGILSAQIASKMSMDPSVEAPVINGLLGNPTEAGLENGELSRTCVSNCTRSKNRQISEKARNCLRNELITMRGRVTEHQIDDLLNGKRLKIWANSQKTMFVSYSRGRLIEHIVDNYESFLN